MVVDIGQRDRAARTVQEELAARAEIARHPAGPLALLAPVSFLELLQDLEVLEVAHGQWHIELRA